MDPPKPKDDEDLSLKEVVTIRDCDVHFDQWNEKYFGIARHVKNSVMFASHKVFQMPFTHFYGYLHLTLRTQEHY